MSLRWPSLFLGSGDEILSVDRTVHAICRWAEIRAAGRSIVDAPGIVLADQPASTSLKAMAFNQQLGHYGLRIISEVENSASTSYAIAAERQSWITEHADFRVSAIERRTS
jgi:hypothetical protein